MKNINHKVLLQSKEINTKFRPENVWAIMLYGSQNYGTDTELSDVDTKAMVIPSTENVLLHKEYLSETEEVTNGLCLVKDFRSMFDNFLKGSLNFLELLYTPYYYVNPEYREEFNELRKNRDLIARGTILRTIYSAAGMAGSEFMRLLKTEEIAKKRKSLMNMVRLLAFMQEYLETRDFGASIHSTGENLEMLKNIRLGTEVPEEELNKTAIIIDAEIGEFLQSRLVFSSLKEDQAKAQAFLESLTTKILKRRMLEEWK